MAIKLLKYEMKSTYRIFFLLYGIILLLALTNGAGWAFRSESLTAISITASSFAIVPIVIVFVYTILQRYNQNLYGDEGYLMFTLPVSSWQIILTKVISTIIWFVVTAIVGVIAITIVYLMASATDKENMISITEVIRLIIKGSNYYGTKMLFCYLFISFSYCLNYLLLIYASISIGNLPFVRKANGAVSVIAYFVISMVESNISTFILHGSGVYNQVIRYSEDLEEIKIISEVIMFQGLIQLIFAAMAFATAVYITSKKVHLK